MTAAAFMLVMPDEFNEFAKEVGYACIMGVNHFFLSQQGYFDTAADSKVLLHAWSLAVEEQFYLVAPLLLALTVAAAHLARHRTELGGRCILWTSTADIRGLARRLHPARQPAGATTPSMSPR